jgi:hypothetical protein
MKLRATFGFVLVFGLLPFAQAQRPSPTPAAQKEALRIRSLLSSSAAKKITSLGVSLRPLLYASTNFGQLQMDASQSAAANFQVLRRSPEALRSIAGLTLYESAVPYTAEGIVVIKDEQAKILEDIRLFRKGLVSLKARSVVPGKHRVMKFEKLMKRTATGSAYIVAPAFPLIPGNYSGLSKKEMQGIANLLEDALDSLNGMSQAESLHLHMAMDRTSKFMEALSNILKKGSDRSDQILKNLK